MTAEGTGGLRIGVVLEAFPGGPLEQVMSWLRRDAPEVTDLEIGAGGWRGDREHPVTCGTGPYTMA